MATRWQVQAAYPRGAPHFRSSIAVHPPDGRERHLLGVPFIDQIFHGAHFLAPPPQAQDAGFEWLSSVELLLLIVRVRVWQESVQGVVHVNAPMSRMCTSACALLGLPANVQALGAG